MDDGPDAPLVHPRDHLGQKLPARGRIVVKAAPRSPVRLIALTNSWARRQFSLYFRDFEALDPAARLMVRHLEACAAGSGG